MIYPIVAYGSPVLKKKCTHIIKGEVDVKEIVQNMFETMTNARGVGLAAPQIGKTIRLFIVDGSPIEGENCENFKQIFINATIIEESGEEWVYNEGCLSIPDVHEDISRKERIKIHYFDENWKEFEEEYDGMAARIIQHEYDHIEGILFTDYLSGMKKRVLKGKLTGLSKGRTNAKYKMKFPLK